MNANVRKRVSARFVATLFLAVALALIPPVLYHNPLYNVFFLDDVAKDFAGRFSDATRWIHAGSIMAIWLLNLAFFFTNEKKGDCGLTLKARTRAQGTLNFLLIALSVAAMIGYRFGLSAEAWIGVLLPSATRSIATLWMPYYIVAVCGLYLWGFCMNAAPATNCAVRWPIARWFDEKMKRAERAR